MTADRRTKLCAAVCFLCKAALNCVLMIRAAAPRLCTAHGEKCWRQPAFLLYCIRFILEMYRSGRNENDSKSKWMLRRMSPYHTRERQFWCPDRLQSLSERCVF